jgi:hypothetical protein
MPDWPTSIATAPASRAFSGITVSELCADRRITSYPAAWYSLRYAWNCASAVLDNSDLLTIRIPVMLASAAPAR